VGDVAVVEPTPSAPVSPAERVADAADELPTFSVFDIETSGLLTNRHHILQVAVARVEHGCIVDEWSSLVSLRWPWQRVGPRRVHGISRRRLRGAPASPDVLRGFAAFTADTVLVAHNMRFDWPFIERAARRGRVELAPAARLCTLSMSRRLDPDRRLSHRLVDVGARYDVVNARPHDAVYDARATALILPHLLAAHGIERGADLESYYER
jgi:DNA polymerase-3 subunit epsilon